MMSMTRNWRRYVICWRNTGTDVSTHSPNVTWSHCSLRWSTTNVVYDLVFVNSVDNHSSVLLIVSRAHDFLWLT